MIILILVAGGVYWFIQHEQLKKECNELSITAMTIGVIGVSLSERIYTSCIRAGGKDEFNEIFKKLTNEK